MEIQIATLFMHSVCVHGVRDVWILEAPLIRLIRIQSHNLYANGITKHCYGIQIHKNQSRRFSSHIYRIYRVEADKSMLLELHSNLYSAK